MEIQEDGYCFVCGPQNPIGLKARFVIDRPSRSARCDLQLAREFQGWENVVHGGMLSSLLDEAAIYACRSVGDKFVTAELQVKFRKPVTVGKPLVVSARVVSEKRKLLAVEGQLEQGGDICAEAQIKVFRLS